MYVHPGVDRIWTCQKILTEMRTNLRIPYSIYSLYHHISTSCYARDLGKNKHTKNMYFLFGLPILGAWCLGSTKFRWKIYVISSSSLRWELEDHVPMEIEVLVIIYSPVSYIAIEHDHKNSGFSHEKLWFSTAMFNYQRVKSLQSQSGSNAKPENPSVDVWSLPAETTIIVYAVPVAEPIAKWLVCGKSHYHSRLPSWHSVHNIAVKSVSSPYIHVYRCLVPRYIMLYIFPLYQVICYILK